MTQELRDRLRRNLVVTMVRSELARRSSGTDPMTAETAMTAVNRLAKESLDHMRNMVRSGLNTTLDRELTRTSPSETTAEALGWIVREGTTNILKHSAAGARIMLVENGHSYALLAESDGTPGYGEPIGPSSRSSADRAGRLGGTENTMESGGTFTVDVRPSAPQSDSGHGKESPSLEEGNA